MNEKVEVIVTTYNNPVSLDLALIALAFQDMQDFSVCIADDGSAEDTKKVIEKWREKFGGTRLRHEWQPDEGFRKNEILNKAILSSKSDYIIFIDGDCISSPSFVRTHVERKSKRSFLSGSVIRIPKWAVGSFSDELIATGEVFKYRWLKSNGGIYSIGSFLKSGILPYSFARVCEKITPVKIVWNGGNSSGWRSDLLAVNGFDESIKYGAEDVDLGVRLNNFGIVGKHIRYTAPLLHLEHDRAYADPVQVKKNKESLRIKRISGAYYAAEGIHK
jgi:glycosyltransferase involved in cell wall biosynthesis